MTASSKTVAFFPTHPSHIWMQRPLAESVSTFAKVVWVLRDIDCSRALADAMGLPYTVVSKAKAGLLGNAAELFLNTFRCWSIARQHKVDLWVTYYGCGNLAARLTGARSLAFNDDDVDIIPLIAWTSYPFADLVLVTQNTRMGRFSAKAVRYPAFHELFYLHPNRFTPDPSVVRELGLQEGEPYALVRLSSLEAHHDKNIRGLNRDLLRKLVDLASRTMRVFISSQKPLPPEFEALRYPLGAHRMIHALAFAQFFLGDSQTMTAEAAVLGTPAFRVSDFVGRLSYVQELEGYGLAFGFRPGEDQRLLSELAQLLETKDRSRVFGERRRRMLCDKIDPVPLWTGVIQMLLQGATRREIEESVEAEIALLSSPCREHPQDLVHGTA